MKITDALRDGAKDVLRAYRWEWTGWAGAYAMIAVVPLVVGDSLRIAALASGLYLVLGAVGLNVAVGFAGLPSLGQGAFVGVGAFAAASLVTRADWGPLEATIAGTALACATALVTGIGVVRLRPVFVAVATWVLSWTLTFTLSSFPALSGGARGLAVDVPPVEFRAVGRIVRMTPGVHLELALALLAVTLAATSVLRRTPLGLGIAAVRQGPSVAAILGIDAARMRLATFVAAAGVGGVAGALSVQLAGVADPSVYGPTLSLKLLVVVLLGGAGTVLGPLVGGLVLALIPALAGWFESVLGIPAERFEPVVVAGLLLFALLAGRRGIIPSVGRFSRRFQPEANPGRIRVSVPTTATAPAALRGVNLSKRFGGVRALEHVSIEVQPGEIHALIGPNGSGKTTCLRVMAGSLPLDEGRALLGEQDLTAASVQRRVAAGVARTLQRTAVFSECSSLEHVIAGMLVNGRYGAFRTLTRTPRAREEAASMTRRAIAILDRLDLRDKASTPSGRLTAGEQRLLMLGTALASGPAVLLADEPAAGLSAGERDKLLSVLGDLRRSGVAVLLVEHDVALVRRIADRVTVLDAGKVIAHGTPEDVVRDSAVREAYLGRNPRS